MRIVDSWYVEPAAEAEHGLVHAHPPRSEFGDVTESLSPARAGRPGQAMLALDREGKLLWLDAADQLAQLEELALFEADGAYVASSWRELFWSHVRAEPADQLNLFFTGRGSWVATTYWRVDEPNIVTVTLVRTSRGPQIDPLWAHILDSVRGGRSRQELHRAA